MESDHLDGDVDMVAVIDTLLEEEQRRRQAGEVTPPPFRPDHGHQLIDDAGRETHPGYPVIGRLRGLAELRGVIAALAYERGYPRCMTAARLCRAGALPTIGEPPPPAVGPR